MMYHFEVSWGESPDLAIAKLTPLESYVGLPCGVKLSDAPFVKSILTDLPSAESAGQLADVRGLQLVYVCAVASDSKLAKPSTCHIDGIIAKLWCEGILGEKRRSCSRYGDTRQSASTGGNSGSVALGW